MMISQSVFFLRGDWVADHTDWHPRIQCGKTVDLGSGDGRRVLAECLQRALLLRSEAEPLADELHRFTAGCVTVTPDHRFHVSRDLVEEFHNGREYERFAGCTITVPNALTDQPDPDMLDWHPQEAFWG